MPKFTDTKNTEWAVEIHILEAKRLREAGYDLFDVEQTIENLGNPYEIYEMLWHLVETQAVELGVDAVEFSRRFEYVAEEATAALVGAVTNFFQRHGKKAVAMMITKTLGAALQKEMEGLKLLESEKTTQAFQQVIQKSLQQAEAELQKISGS